MGLDSRDDGGAARLDEAGGARAAASAEMMVGLCTGCRCCGCASEVRPRPWRHNRGTITMLPQIRGGGFLMSRCRRAELELKARLHLVVAIAAVHPHRAAGVHAGDPLQLWRDMLISFPGGGPVTWPHAPHPWLWLHTPTPRHHLGACASCSAAKRAPPWPWAGLRRPRAPCAPCPQALRRPQRARQAAREASQSASTFNDVWAQVLMCQCEPT